MNYTAMLCDALGRGCLV